MVRVEEGAGHGGRGLHPILAVRGSGEEERQDSVAVEAPLEIRIVAPDEHGIRRDRSISITMRTPGHDADLALGYLVTEGVIREPSDVLPDSVSGAWAAVNEEANTATVTLRGASRISLSNLDRSGFSTGACGMCGKTSLAAVRTGPYAHIEPGLPKAPREVIVGLASTVGALQADFRATGGEHASALMTAAGEIVCLREDIGRHNALDKVIGDAFRRGALPLGGLMLFLSGRASFELVQKSAMAGIPFIVAVGAPSSAAVDVAMETGITLIGFARGDRFNVYSGRERVAAR